MESGACVDGLSTTARNRPSGDQERPCNCPITVPSERSGAPVAGTRRMSCSSGLDVSGCRRNARCPPSGDQSASIAARKRYEPREATCGNLINLDFDTDRVN